MTTNKQLRELAEKATPGPWWIDSHGHRMSAGGGSETGFIASEKRGEAKRHPETGNLSHWPNDWDASFIAAANPATVLTLLDAYEALQAECEKLRRDAERYRWLRDKSESLHSFYLSTPVWMTGVRFRPENVDRTIDAAMQETSHDE